MSYVVLARRLRPIRFEDLIGQETAAQTLRNAVIADRVAHAFLFSGSRGVGKTSAARILTRALNCLNQENGDPCNICENCIEISQNASPDVYEIDAASNRGIDNIRELRENVNYVPARCRYKVYIIDEAHMLTLESFNALLKTLEEPPSYVKFIFATTDPHKIPQTIISRCQRYDFLRIPIKTMVDYLEKVVLNEELELSRGALEMIARNSVGGMRDALTSIDQILSFSGTSASDQKVAQILGILDSESRFAFTNALLKKNEGEALSYFYELQEYGHDTHNILADLLQTIKTTALVKSLGTSTALFQDISGDDLEIFASLSEAVSVDELQQIFNVLIELEEQMKHSVHTKICFEMAILQIASIQPLVGLPEIINGIKNLRNGGPPTETNSENATFVKAIPEESTNPPTDNSSEKHHNILSVDSRVKKQPADASVIKNILQSETKETHKRADNQDNAVNPKSETLLTEAQDQERTSYFHQNEDNSYIGERTVDPEKSMQNISMSMQGFTQTPETSGNFSQTSDTQENHGIDKKREITEIQLNYTQTEKASENQQIPRTFETNTLAPETLEKQEDYSQNHESEEKTVENESLTEMLNIAESSEKPAQEWTDFADEVKKRSSMLASFVRNAVPQILTGTQLSLAFKSGNYPSMFTEKNRSLLQEIATDWCGHAVHVSCEIALTETSKLTIVEHEQILFEQSNELKRKNAREFPQVKDILDVFTNSKISAIEL